MNVYAKLQKCRVQLQSMNLKKSGQNTYANYDYFDLSDFLPAINEMFDGIGLFSQISFTTDVATMTVINTDKPDEQIIFTSPMSEANLKGCHAIQNVGAVQSYQRRYLYMTALEIVEQDALDKTTGKDSQASQKTTHSAQTNKTYNQPSTQSQPSTTQSSTSSEAITSGQIGLIKKLVADKKIPDNMYRVALGTYGVTSSTGMNKRDASALIKRLTDYVQETVPPDDDLPF